jgi:hypothetical protein
MRSLIDFHRLLHFPVNDLVFFEGVLILDNSSASRADWCGPARLEPADV